MLIHMSNLDAIFSERYHKYRTAFKISIINDPLIILRYLKIIRILLTVTHHQKKIADAKINRT